MKSLRIQGLLALMLFLPATAMAAGVRVVPGLWEFTSSLPDVLGSEAGRQTHRTCIRDSTITPEQVMARLKECRIWDAKVQGALAKWKMKCETPAGPMVGSGSLKTTGSAISGSLDMTFTLGSLEIPATSSFQGRRVGPCG